MNLSAKLSGKLTRFVGKQVLRVKHWSPEICVAGGISLGVAALVFVGIKTYKNKEIIHDDIHKVKSNQEKYILCKVVEDDYGQPKFIRDADKNEKPARIKYKDLPKEVKDEIWAGRIDLAKDIVKTYWLPATMEIGSIWLVWKGRKILRGRLTEITAAYTVLADRFKKYRDKTRSLLGKEKEEEISTGTFQVEGTDENGEQARANALLQGGEASQYACVFDEGEFDEGSGEFIWRNNYWARSKLHNLAHIRSVQNTYTDILRSIGWVCWRDVKKDLGLKPMPGDNRIGWIYKDGRVNRVELGVFNEGGFQLECNKNFEDIHNPQNWCIIEPNLDGIIDCVFDDIEKYDKRCGRRSKKKFRFPSNEEMFGREYAEKL